MKLVAGIVAALLVALQLVSAQTIVELCQTCTMVNGAGFRDLPSDCTKFLSCVIDENGNINGTIQHCAFSTYWDNSVLTCQKAERITCPTEMCMGQADGVMFSSESNCRGYWECQNGKANAMCCPDGQYYYNTTVGCVDNDDNAECFNYCYNIDDGMGLDLNDTLNNETITTTPPPPCDKRPFPGNPAYFEQEVPGFVDRFVMPCASGTNYVQESCGCVAIVAPVPFQKATCRPEIFLPFTDNHLDESGNGYHVRNENVIVVDGVAEFNGINSRLIVPRFTNLEHSETVVIKVKYVSDHMASSELHAVVSNSDCGNYPSILVAEYSNYIRYAVGTSSVDMVNVFVPQNQTTLVKDISYKFDDGTLTGSTEYNSLTEDAPGYLRNVQCALHIGHADNMLPFNGKIDEISVYLCNPEEV